MPGVRPENGGKQAQYVDRWWDCMGLVGPWAGKLLKILQNFIGGS